MNYPAEKYPWLSILLGFALVFVWGLISLAHAYDRGLRRMNDSFIQGFMIVEQLAAVRDELGRLSVDQQAFLSTGDTRFQDGVIASVERITIQIGTLNSLAAESKLPHPHLTSLSRSIDQVLGSVGESDAIRQSRGARAAVAYFDSREIAISEAQLQANQLRSGIARGISERARNARSPKALLQDVLYGVPAGIAIEPGTPAVRVSTHAGIQ